MTTKEFNRERAEEWLEKIDKNECKLFLMIGIKPNSFRMVMSDKEFTDEELVIYLEALAQTIRESITKPN